MLYSYNTYKTLLNENVNYIKFSNSAYLTFEIIMDGILKKYTNYFKELNPQIITSSDCNNATTYIFNGTYSDYGLEYANNYVEAYELDKKYKKELIFPFKKTKKIFLENKFVLSEYSIIHISYILDFHISTMLNDIVEHCITNKKKIINKQIIIDVLSTSIEYQNFIEYVQ